MAFDALLKRFFPAVVLGLIALAAYFQASALTALVVSSVFDTGTTTPTVDDKTKAAHASTTAPEPRTPKTAEPILSRNPFDSQTGPLNKLPESDSAEPEAATQADLSNPLAAPDCGGIAAHVITESTDPTWSIAVLQATGETLGKMRRVGDAVGDKQVAYIGYNPKKNSPSVWLTGGAALCQVLLFAQAPETPPPQPAADPNAAKTAANNGVPKDISDKIQKISDTEFHVDRAVVDNILENQAQLMRTARIVPEQKDGKVVGIRLFGIRPDTLLGKLGLQNGDRLETINGFDMASPEKALEAYAHLRTSDALSVKVTRRGSPVNIDFKIQ